MGNALLNHDLKLWPRGKAPVDSLCGEDKRLAVMASYGFDQLEGDAELARIAKFAARLCETPTCLVSLVELERQRFLVREGLEATETPRSTSFCAHAMLGGETMVVTDATEHPVFKDFPLVVGEPHIRFYAGAPLVSPEGAPLGSLCVIDYKPRPEGLSDFQREGLELLADAVMQRLYTHRGLRAAGMQLRRSEAQFQKLADSIPDIAWSADSSGFPLYFNQRYYEFTGREPGVIYQDMFIESLHPDEQDRLKGEWHASRANGHPHEAEYRLRRGDGEYVWMLSRAVPLKGEDGEVSGWFGTVTDIDNNHRIGEARELVANELSHRIKNIFAVVSGLISLRARGAEELSNFAKEINETIRTLARAHDFVRPFDNQSGDDFLELIEVLMAPYQDKAGQRIAITGDSIPIASRIATPVALVFHELATNASKYGALSVDGGTVAISSSNDGEKLAIEWRENGGPKIGAPESTSFGARLIDTAVSAQLGGSIDREWDEDGLKVTMALPLARLKEKQV